MRTYFFKMLVIFSLLIIITSCDSDDAAEILKPLVTSGTTNENVEVTYTSIKITGTVSSEGGSEITYRGVCWSTNPNPTINDSKTIENSNQFISTISDLTANSTYYFRVYATSSVGTSYSVEQSFSTASLDGTKWDFLVTSGTTNGNVEVTFTTIKIEGNVSYDGGSEITSRGVCWSTNPSPTIDDSINIENSNEFISTISDLIANTTYYFRVFATTRVGTRYAVEKSFSTASLGGTKWDFQIVYKKGVSWNADVILNSDGTSVYDEPKYAGEYLSYGNWSLDGNKLTYALDSSNNVSEWIFSGTLLDNGMSGTLVNSTDPVWTATKY